MSKKLNWMGRLTMGLALTGAMVGLAATTAQARQATHPNAIGVALDDEDPVTGVWEGTVSGDVLPEDVDVTVTLEMDDDNAVTGTIEQAGQDGSVSFEGVFDPEKKELTGTVSSPDPGSDETADFDVTFDNNTFDGTISFSKEGQTISVDISCKRVDDDE